MRARPTWLLPRGGVTSGEAGSGSHEAHGYSNDPEEDRNSGVTGTSTLRARLAALALFAVVLVLLVGGQAPDAADLPGPKTARTRLSQKGNSKKEPGLAFSTNRVTSNYAFALSTRPAHNVSVTIGAACVDAGLLRISPGAVFVFTPADYKTPRTVQILAVKSAEDVRVSRCRFSGLKHASRSADPAYDGIDATLALFAETEETEDPLHSEETDEWITEEVLEAEDGPIRAMAALDRSRSVYDFFHHAKTGSSKYGCRLHARSVNLQDQAFLCFLKRGTEEETPFYVLDPSGGFDEDGWNGFPVALLFAGVSSGGRNADVVAATRIAERWRPRRGRLIVIPVLNPRARLHPGSAAPPAGGQPLTEELWDLAQTIRPDLLLELRDDALKSDEGVSGSTMRVSYVSSTKEAAPLADALMSVLNRVGSQPAGRQARHDATALSAVALKCERAYKTRGLVHRTLPRVGDTTARAKDHLEAVAGLLVAINVFHAHDRNPAKASPSLCVSFPRADPLLGAGSPVCLGEPVNRMG